MLIAHPDSVKLKARQESLAKWQNPHSVRARPHLSQGSIKYWDLAAVRGQSGLLCAMSPCPPLLCLGLPTF